MNLERFSFTPTETKAYLALLTLGPSTGYAVARRLGIARANAYQALDGLVRRGAARRTGTSPLRFTATPPQSLTSELRRSFERDLSVLEESLSRLPQEAPSGGQEFEVFDSVADFLAATAVVADSAGRELLVVTGPWAPPLGAALERAAARGVVLRAVSLGVPAPRLASIREVGESELRGYWGGLPVAVVADRSRAIWGVLMNDARASAVATTIAGAVPFIRHLLRRELASGSSPTSGS